LYLYSKKSILINLIFRGVYLSRIKNNKKQTLIFLRSPKHFNVGKRKVISFNNKKAEVYSLNLQTSTDSLNHPLFYSNLLLKTLLFNNRFRVNSTKVTLKTKILWQ
jgi:hypothetical protein